jgi:hypothetical protein
MNNPTSAVSEEQLKEQVPQLSWTVHLNWNNHGFRVILYDNPYIQLKIKTQT